MAQMQPIACCLLNGLTHPNPPPLRERGLEIASMGTTSISLPAWEGELPGPATGELLDWLRHLSYPLGEDLT